MMKQIVPLIILILYSILQARRKALREQKRREAAAFVPAKGSPEPLGAVTAAENLQVIERQSATMEVSDRWKNMTEEADRFVDVTQAEAAPEIEQVIDRLRRAKQTAVTATPSYDEIVDTRDVVTQGAPVDAYEQVTVARRRISFDKAALRTFFVTREALGPPRARKPFRPGIKARE